MAKVTKMRIVEGVYWIEIPEVELKLLCGCPEDSVKHLMRRGLINLKEENEITYETGPNAILLSDVMIQNGQLSNLAEFPVLQMLYRQGMMLPEHPNNNGTKPLIIGSEKQVNAQMEYIFRGNYGLSGKEEIMQTGIDEAQAEEMMNLKLRFAFGSIRKTQELLDACYVEEDPVEITQGVFIKRQSLNRFEISYEDESILVDLNLNEGKGYPCPYPLGFYNLKRDYFAVVHSGQGDGWNVNEPCMGSVVMFQGKIYLIDAGPNLRNTLISLGISINEIEGIFHTHCHDDHFCGLQSLIQQSDHKIKYYSTPLVRASVTKKLCALLHMEEESFKEYFEICDIDFDTWNNIEGLEVMPIFSPHPVETNIFLFRTLWEGGYRTYAHLADIASFKVLDGMVHSDSKPGISKSSCETIKKTYLQPANLKKIDIGGGLIHGMSIDFKQDTSEKIILAHVERHLGNHEKEIGSSAPFGMIDSIIPDFSEFLSQKARHYLKSYFPSVPDYYLQILLNNPVVTFNPESIIIKENDPYEYIYLILTGNVEKIQTLFNMHGMLSAGAICGDISGSQNSRNMITYRAANFVQALKIPASLYLGFVKHNNLYDEIDELQDKRFFLQHTYLFGESISYPIHNSIAMEMDEMTVEEDAKISLSDDSYIYLLKQGKVELYRKNKILEALQSGDFIGEEQAKNTRSSNYNVKILSKSTFYKIPYTKISQIPIVLWKLVETHEKRKYLR